MQSKILTIRLILLAIILIMIGCENGTEPSSFPMLTTTEVSNITSSSALSGGNIWIVEKTVTNWSDPSMLSINDGEISCSTKACPDFEFVHSYPFKGFEPLKG